MLGIGHDVEQYDTTVFMASLKDEAQRLLDFTRSEGDAKRFDPATLKENAVDAALSVALAGMGMYRYAAMMQKMDVRNEFVQIVRPLAQELI